MLVNRPRVVSHSLPRLDGRPKVTGKHIYGSDVALPGMLFGKVFRSTQPHARIARLDVERARSLPGVMSVLTSADIKPIRYGVAIKDTTVLAVDRVICIGQPIALVAATSGEIAAKALELIEIEYEALEPVFDPETALLPGAPQVHPEWRDHGHGPAYQPRGGNLANRARMHFGDVDSAFKAGFRTYTHRFTTAMVHAGYTEPRVATAAWESPDSVTVWTNVQTPYETQNTLSEILELSPSQVRLVTPATGGGFGGKLRIGVDHYAALLARAAGRPVRIISSTHEELTAAHPRQSAIVTLETAVDEKGRILARRGRFLLDCGSGAGSGPGTAAVGLHILIGPYRTPAFDLEGLAVYTNKLPSGSFRAPAGPMANFAVESQMDMIAADLGIDPLEMRLRNIVREGDTGPSGEKLESISIEECLRKAADAIGWGKAGSRGSGKGIACSWWVAASAGSSGVFVKIGPDGKVLLNSGAVEIGTAALTGAAQILAEALALDLDDIHIATVDTQTAPYDFGSQGSRTMLSVGNACLDAAKKLREQLFALAGEKLGVDQARLRLADKCVVADDKSVSIAALAAQSQASGGGLVAAGTFHPPKPFHDATRFENHPLPVWIGASYYAHAVDLSVDEMTGEVSIGRYVVAQDVGYAVNPMYVRGQIEGGVVQGLGQALSEEIVLDQGRVRNPNLTDYKMLTMMDVPDIESHLIESHFDLGPHGAKGVGEPPIVTPPAAVANAIAAATETWITSLPITAEKIALAKKGLRNDAVHARGTAPRKEVMPA